MLKSFDICVDIFDFSYTYNSSEYSHYCCIYFKKLTSLVFSSECIQTSYCIQHGCHTYVDFYGYTGKVYHMVDNLVEYNGLS